MIAEELNTQTLEELFEKDESLLIGLRNFLALINNKFLDQNFLPYVAFIDAAQKQHAISRKAKPDPPHKVCSLFAGKSRKSVIFLNIIYLFKSLGFLMLRGLQV